MSDISLSDISLSDISLPDISLPDIWNMISRDIIEQFTRLLINFQVKAEVIKNNIVCDFIKRIETELDSKESIQYLEDKLNNIISL